MFKFSRILASKLVNTKFLDMKTLGLQNFSDGALNDIYTRPIFMLIAIRIIKISGKVRKLLFAINYKIIRVFFHSEAKPIFQGNTQNNIGIS